jgi:hypothetical protein
MSSCPHCLAGNRTVEISGMRFHTLPDRWISCSPVEQQQQVMVPVRSEPVGRKQSVYQAICESSVIRLGRRFYTPHHP